MLTRPRRIPGFNYFSLEKLNEMTVEQRIELAFRLETRDLSTKWISRQGLYKERQCLQTQRDLLSLPLMNRVQEADQLSAMHVAKLTYLLGLY